MAGALNSFEGGTDAVTITTGNSGGVSGDAFSAASNVSFSTDRAAHGLLSGKTTSGVTGTVTHALSGSGVRWARAYVYLSGAGGPADLMTMNLATGSQNSYFIDYTGSARLRTLVSGTLTTLQQASLSMVGQWIRVEMQATSASSGAAEARFYAADAVTPLLTLSGSAARTADTWTTAVYGGSNLYTARYVDDVGWSDVDWLGAAAGRAPAPLRHVPTAAQRASRW